MKTNFKAASYLIVGLFLLATGCAEPDEPKTPPPSKVLSQDDSAAVPATEQLLNEKYDKLDLNCRLDIADKLKANGPDVVESKSTSAKFNLLKSLGFSPAIQMKLDMTDLQSTWELSIQNVTLSHVTFSSSTDSFEADRSPVIAALLKGTMKKPTKPISANQKSIQIDMANSENKIYENTTISLVDFFEGPTSSANFSLKVSCRLEALPKPEFAGEFRRK